MFDTTQPGPETTASHKGEREGDQWSQHEHVLSAPAGITSSLSTNLKRSAKDWSRPKGPTIGALAHLHAGPDLAVAVHEKGEQETNRSKQNGHDLAERDQEPAEGEAQSIRPTPPRSCWPEARAAHSAMVTLARAMGLVGKWKPAPTAPDRRVAASPAPRPLKSGAETMAPGAKSIRPKVG